MRGTDIPGTFRLEHIRGVIRTIAEGTTSTTDISSKTSMSSRHVSFALHSARLLGWLVGDPKSWQITAAGIELLDTSPGSLEEAWVFRRGIAGCAVVLRNADAGI